MVIGYVTGTEKDQHNKRTFITNLASKSVSVRVLAVLAGHSSIATTQRYIDVNDQQLRNAVELA
jgi:integrase/recombinase XerD